MSVPPHGPPEPVAPPGPLPPPGPVVPPRPREPVTPGEAPHQREEWPEWVRARLFERRVVFVTETLDHGAASLAAAQLMTLDATGDEPVNMQVDCGGGTLEAAFALIDVIDLLGVAVHATCTGRLEGPPVGVLAVAARRIATPHARFRLTEPSCSTQGTASELTAWIEHHRRQLERFYDRLSRATGRPAADIAADSVAGRYLDAEQARRFGLVDEIARRPTQLRPWPPRDLGSRPGLGH